MSDRSSTSRVVSLAQRRASSRSESPRPLPSEPPAARRGAASLRLVKQPPALSADDERLAREMVARFAANVLGEGDGTPISRSKIPLRRR